MTRESLEQISGGHSSVRELAIERASNEISVWSQIIAFFGWVAHENTVKANSFRTVEG